MRRREFITSLAGAALLSSTASAQRPVVPTIGYLSSERPDVFREILAAFNSGLSDAGYIHGRKVAFEYRWADTHNDRLPALAVELVRRRVDMIVTVGTAATLAAKGATTTIPILFYNGADPVRARLVESLPRPGGNVTGITNLASGLA